MEHKKTRSGFERHMNDEGIPYHEKKSNGGRVKDGSNYGSFLRIHDPNLFESMFQAWMSNDHV